jgi:hypothetical protein
MLRSTRGILRDKGKLLLFVPALPWLYGSLDRKVGHQRRYTLRSLREVVEGAGFSVEFIRYFDMVGVLPWFIAGRVSRMATFSDRAARLYDRLVVPTARAMERRLRPPIGKNLLCVAEATNEGE